MSTWWYRIVHSINTQIYFQLISQFGLTKVIEVNKYWLLVSQYVEAIIVSEKISSILTLYSFSVIVIRYVSTSIRQLQKEMNINNCTPSPALVWSCMCGIRDIRVDEREAPSLTRLVDWEGGKSPKETWALKDSFRLSGVQAWAKRITELSHSVCGKFRFHVPTISWLLVQ